jgi:hypothetical protein
LTVSLIFKYSSVSSIFSSLTVLVVTLFRENVVKAIKSVAKMKSELIAFTTFSLNNVTTSTVKEENIDDTDEYLNIRETVNYVNINKSPN